MPCYLAGAKHLSTTETTVTNVTYVNQRIEWNVYEPVVYKIDNLRNEATLKINADIYGRVVELVCRGGCGFG